MLHEAKHKLIIIAGIGDSLSTVSNFYSRAEEIFTNAGFVTYTHKPRWELQRHPFEMLDEVEELRDQITVDGSKTSLLGLSAGGELALASAADYPNGYEKIVAVSAITNTEQVSDFPTFRDIEEYNP